MLWKMIDRGILASVITLVWMIGSHSPNGLLGYGAFVAPVVAALGAGRAIRKRDRSGLDWLGLGVNVLVLCLVLTGWVFFFTGAD